MWLPKDERRLLALFYRQQKKQEDVSTTLDINTELVVNSEKLLKIVGDQNRSYKLSRVIERLERRELLSKQFILKMKPKGNVYQTDSILLTDAGYDLGRKYNHWFSYLDLWWQEYRGNPIWIVLGFVLTTATAYFVGRLSK